MEYESVRLKCCFGFLLLAMMSACLASAQNSLVAHLPTTTRAEIVARGRKLADHNWICGPQNLQASCAHKYVSDWKIGQHITGIPYSWGGADDVQSFDNKLAKGMAAGGHSRFGVLSCTTGIDCSAFITYCWGVSMAGHPYSTTTLRVIAAKPKYNWFTDMKPGDALYKAGYHVVLFTGYNGDGTINICEASGSAARVVCHSSSWSRLKGYVPLQYKGIDE
jgi:hypothetical protein